MPVQSARTRTWSVPTSPRNPYKLPEDIRLLSRFEGQPWTRQTQRRFAAELAASESYEGTVSANLPDLSARDRTRAPKTFGFARIRRDEPIRITPAGDELIRERGLDDLFLRQLLKWQYP